MFLLPQRRIATPKAIAIRPPLRDYAHAHQHHRIATAERRLVQIPGEKTVYKAPAALQYDRPLRGGAHTARHRMTPSPPLQIEEPVRALRLKSIIRQRPPGPMRLGHPRAHRVPHPRRDLIPALTQKRRRLLAVHCVEATTRSTYAAHLRPPYPIKDTNSQGRVRLLQSRMRVVPPVAARAQARLPTRHHSKGCGAPNAQSTLTTPPPSRPPLSTARMIAVRGRQTPITVIPVVST